MFFMLPRQASMLNRGGIFPATLSHQSKRAESRLLRICNLRIHFDVSAVSNLNRFIAKSVKNKTN